MASQGMQVVFLKCMRALNVWTPTVGKVLPAFREPSNGCYRHAICIKIGGEIVGHVSRQFSHTWCGTFSVAFFLVSLDLSRTKSTCYKHVHTCA